VSRLEAEVARAELAVLRARLQPHFLFNTLQSIAMLIPREPEAAQRMTLNLGELLRAAFARGDAQEVRLGDELALARAYVDIEAERFRDRLAVRWCVDDAPADARVPDLVLQPLVENALRHGIGPKIGGGRVDIIAGHDRESLTLEVRDNGVGMPPDTLDKFNGVGLRNTRSRLQHLYGSKHRFDVRTPSGVGLAVTIVMPFVSETAMPESSSDTPATGSPMESVA